MNDQTMTAQIIKELTIVKDSSSEVMSKQVMSWEKRIEAEQSQKAMLDSLRAVKSLAW